MLDFLFFYYKTWYVFIAYIIHKNPVRVWVTPCLEVNLFCVIYKKNVALKSLFYSEYFETFWTYFTSETEYHDFFSTADLWFMRLSSEPGLSIDKYDPAIIKVYRWVPRLDIPW